MAAAPGGSPMTAALMSGGRLLYQPGDSSHCSHIGGSAGVDILGGGTAGKAAAAAWRQVTGLRR